MQNIHQIVRGAVEMMARNIGLEVTVDADGFVPVRCMAIINYDAEIMDPVTGDRQGSTVEFPVSVFPARVPNKITVTETETGNVHRVINIKRRPHSFICYCELAEPARKFSGPFTARNES